MGQAVVEAVALGLGAHTSAPARTKLLRLLVEADRGLNGSS